MAVNIEEVSQNDGYLPLVNKTLVRQEGVLYVPLASIVVVLFVSILGNSFVIAAFFRDSRLKVIFNLFVVHLAAADIILSVIVTLVVVGELAQVSMLGTWTFFCQLCAVCANAVPVEQLILVHIMCHHRHKALQLGMSYTRNSFHWHIEKLVLFLTWVITVVGSFLMTDLMSSVKLFGYGSCKFPGRLLYMSYTSFVHFTLLASLAMAVFYITWEFRKQRKGPHFERLSIELEDRPILLTCRASANWHQNNPSLQSLIPRSPLLVFRNVVSFPSPELHRPTCLPMTNLSSLPRPGEDVLRTDTGLSQIPYVKEPLILDDIPALSYAEVSCEALRFNVHGAQSSGYHEKLSGVDWDENFLMTAGGQHREDQHKYGDMYMLCELNVDRIQHKKTLCSTDTTGLHGDGCSYDTAHELVQKTDLNGPNDNSVQKLGPVHAESQYRDSGGGCPIESVEAKGEPVVRSTLVTKGKYEHCKENQETEAVVERSEGTDERVFAESLEDLLPASVSLSDDELADIPQLYLRPRTDSLYTLRSGLSVSEESLSKTLDELMDVSSQSEISVSSGISEVGVKSRKEKRNDNRLFTIGDEEEEQSEPTTVCDTKSLSDLASRTNPANTLQEQVPPAVTHCHLDVPSSPGDLIGGDSMFISVPELVSENEQVDVEKSPPVSQALSTGEESGIGRLSDMFMVKAPIDGIRIAKQELLMMPFVESESNCSLSPTDNNVDTHLPPPSDENTTRNEVYQQLPGQTLQINHQGEVTLQINHQGEVTLQINHQEEIQYKTTHPCEDPEYSEADQSRLKNTNENGDENNSAGNKKVTDKKIKSHGLKKQKKNISPADAFPVSGDNIYTPNALTNGSETVEEPILSSKTRQQTNEQCVVSIHSITTDFTEGLTSEEKNLVKFHGRNVKYKRNSIIRDNISDVQAKGMNDSKLNVGNLKYDVNHFDVLSAGSSEYVNVEQHSQRDIEIAVEGWMEFYGISPRGQYCSSEYETDHDKKLLESCRFPQQCKNFIPQAGHSMRCNSLVRARQLWLDFYGIEVLEKEVQGVSLQSNGPLLTVAVEVHAVDVDSCDACVVSEQANAHPEQNFLKQGFLVDPAQVEEAKTTKRLKRMIKYRNERPSSGCEVPSGLGCHACATKLGPIAENFKQNGNYLDKQQRNTEEESLHESLSDLNFHEIGVHKAEPSDTTADQQRNTEKECLGESLSDYSDRTDGNKANPNGTTVPKESFQTLHSSHPMNQSEMDNGLPTLPSHRHKIIDTGLEDNPPVNVERALSPQIREISFNPASDCTPDVSSHKRLTCHSAEEASFLEDITPVPAEGKAPAFSCIFSLENGSGSFECYNKELECQREENAGVDHISSKEFDNQIEENVKVDNISSKDAEFDYISSKEFEDHWEENARVDYISSKEFEDHWEENARVDYISSKEFEDHWEENARVDYISSKVCEDQTQENARGDNIRGKEFQDQVKENARIDHICGKELAVNSVANARENFGLGKLNELEKSGQQGEISFINVCNKYEEQSIFPEANDEHLVDIARRSDYNIYQFDKAVVENERPVYQFTKSKSGDSCVLGKHELGANGSISSGKASEVAVTTYQILESLSITCRALLAELGIYQDILEGVIPLDKEVVCQKGVEWMAPCPDCQRRQQEKLGRMSGTVLGSAQGSGASASAGSEAGQAGDVSWNAWTDTQANNSTGLHHLTIDELKGERSTPGSEVSSLGVDMFQDLEEGGTGTSLSTSRTDDFIRMVRRLPGMMKTLRRKCSIEELKARDPELCILLSLICIVSLQLICWLPIVVLYMVYDATEFPPTPSCMELFFLLLWCSRMAIQPVLYAVYSKYFHQNYIELITCRRCR